MLVFLSFVSPAVSASGLSSLSGTAAAESHSRRAQEMEQTYYT